MDTEWLHVCAVSERVVDISKWLDYYLLYSYDHLGHASKKLQASSHWKLCYTWQNAKNHNTEHKVFYTDCFRTWDSSLKTDRQD